MELLSKKEREYLGQQATRVWNTLMPGGRGKLKAKLNYKSTSIEQWIITGRAKKPGIYTDYFKAGTEVSIQQKEEAAAACQEMDKIISNIRW